MQNVKFIAIPIVKLSTENLIHIRQISADTQEFYFCGKKSTKLSFGCQERYLTK